MSEHLSTEPYKGVRDFYPADWTKVNALFDTARNTLHAWGYEEYNASPLERAELYEAKTSEEIVDNETYTFTDRGDRRVTLRPEMTPTLARMVAAKRRDIPFPLRWFSIGNRFRYERPQRGRLREFYQIDVDLIGLQEGAADVEILRLASAILKACGAEEKDFTIRINSRPLLNAVCEAAGLSGDSIRAYLRLLDKKAKISQADFTSALSEITSKDPLIFIDEATDARVNDEKQKLVNRIEELKRFGTPNVVFDPTITRGFDYYTGMVFEVYDTNPENARAMFGGGRYDRLLSLFGGEQIPAVGFALGEVTLGDFLETHNLQLEHDTASAELYLGTPSVSDISSAQIFADTLREAGARVFVNLTDKGLGDQIKDAVKRGIPFFLAYGESELKEGSGKLKTLATGTEETLSLSTLAATLKERL